MSAEALVQDDTAWPMEFSTAIHLNEIPLFAGNELQRLYGHIHSSLLFMRVFRSTDRVSTYVVRHGATPTVILLFRVEGRRIVVLNQTMRIEPLELRRYAACMFDRFPSVGVISFKAVQSDILNFPYPVQREHAMEDIFIDLPGTVRDYTARLGKSTRGNLRNYKARLERDFSSVRFQSYEKEEIDEQLIHELIRLSEIRIAAKHITFGIDREDARRIVALAKLCGVVNVLWVDGRLCAGVVSYRTGASQTAEIIAHDEKYNYYSPGMLCLYLDICESIAKGVRKYHMGGGRLDYKIRLSAVQQNMEQVEIYRPYRGRILNCDWVVKTMLKARILGLKTWLRSHETNFAVRLLLRSRTAMRKIMKGAGCCYAITFFHYALGV